MHLQLAAAIDDVLEAKSNMKAVGLNRSLGGDDGERLAATDAAELDHLRVKLGHQKSVANGNVDQGGRSIIVIALALTLGSGSRTTAQAQHQVESGLLLLEREEKKGKRERSEQS